MNGPTKPVPQGTSSAERIKRNVLAMRSQGATDEDVEAYLTEHEHLKPEESPGVLERAGGQIKGFVQSVAHDPLGAVESLVAAPFKSFADAVLAPGVGEARHDPRLSKGGNSSAAPIGGTFDKAHGAVTGKERTAAGLQTLANVAFPAVAGSVAGGAAKLGVPKLFSNALGTATAGGVTGATYSPDDPLAGAVAGATLTPVLGAAGKRVGRAAGSVASKVMDMAGRPMESRPAVKVGPLEVGQIEGVADRAARENAEGFDRANLSALDLLKEAQASGKPLAAVDVAGVQGQRMARGLKTSSPVAESALRGVLEPRTEGAIERVIDHAKELTGIKRQNAYETHEALKARTLAEGDEAYGKVWGKNRGGAISDPQQLADIEKLRTTPAGGQAWSVAQKMMANDGVETMGAVPPGFTPEQWAEVQASAESKGIPLPGAVKPTLQQLHYWKLALDDLKQPGLDRGAGSGGIGYNMGKSIHGVQRRLLAIMDEANPDYKKARAQFADNKSLENASESGTTHWTRDPAESKAMLKDMSPAEQKVYRDQAFDKWAERVENGPENVGKSQNKSLNEKRLRLLFPDDKGFETFKQGLEKEMRMHASEKGVLTGSNTADKLADMADMAGVAIPAVIRAMRGNPAQLAGQVARALLADKMRAGTDAVAVERANQLTAGGNGDALARRQALERIARQQSRTNQRRPSFAGLLTAGSTGRAPDQRTPTNAP